MTASRGSTQERHAYLALAAMAVCFGGTWVAGKWVADAIPPFTIAALRFGIASLLLFAWARVAGRRLADVRWADVPLILGLGLTAIAGYNWLFLTGLTLAPASDGAIIVPGTVPIFTTLMAWVFLRERLGARGVIGMAIAVGGLLLVIGPSGEGAATRLTGDLLYLAGAALWSAYNVLSRLGGGRFDAISLTLYGMVAGTLVLVPGALLEGAGPQLNAAPLDAWVGLLYLSVFGSVLAFVLLQVGLARIGATRSSAFALLIPVVGVLLSVLILGEPLSPYTIVGGAIVVLGLWVIQSRPAPRTLPAPQAAAFD